MTRKCSSYLTPSSIKQVVHALVLSNLEYCTIIWSSATKKNLYNLQVAQNKAARLALSCSIHTNTEVMHTSLSWLTVKQNIYLNLLLLVVNFKRPTYFAEGLVSVSVRHGHSTRGASNHCRLYPDRGPIY